MVYLRSLDEEIIKKNETAATKSINSLTVSPGKPGIVLKEWGKVELQYGKR